MMGSSATSTRALPGAGVRLRARGAKASELADVAAWVWEQNAWRPATTDSSELMAPPRVAGGRYIDPVSRAAVGAVRLLRPAFDWAHEERRACVLAARTSNAFSVAQFEAARLSGHRLSPLLFSHSGWNVPAALAAAEAGCRGFVATVCAAECEAFWWARRILDQDRADVAIVGCAEIETTSDNDGEIEVVACGRLFLLTVDSIPDLFEPTPLPKGTFAP